MAFRSLVDCLGFFILRFRPQALNYKKVTNTKGIRKNKKNINVVVI